MDTRTPFTAARLLLVSLAVAALALLIAASASAAAPQNTAPPKITGTAREGQVLTASTGTWSNSPTSFTYQWLRCASDGTGCGAITGATSSTYTLVAGDVGHTLRVAVTAANADGKATARSAATDVVDSKNGPTNTVKPTVSGVAQVGETLTVSDGTWTPAPSSYTRQWQRCGSDGTFCRNIAGATGKTYGVGSADVGDRLRALVTAHTSGGEQATVASSLSAVVTSNTVTTTQTVTTPPPKAPTVRILSLRRVRTRIVMRYRVCVQQSGTVRLTERDHKVRELPFTRHWSVVDPSCGTYKHSWRLLPRYRSPGRLVVTLRASSQGQLSRLAQRSIAID